LGGGEFALGDEEGVVEHAGSGNRAGRRGALGRVGAFSDELRLLGHPEAEWTRRLQRAGGDIVYVPDAWLWHRRTPSELRLRRLAWRNFLRGRGQSINGATFGLEYRSRRLARSIRAQLAHAQRERCSVGLIRAAQDAGRLLGNAELRARAWRSRHQGGADLGDSPAGSSP